MRYSQGEIFHFITPPTMAWAVVSDISSASGTRRVFAGQHLLKIDTPLAKKRRARSGPLFGRVAP